MCQQKKKLISQMYVICVMQFLVGFAAFFFGKQHTPLLLDFVWHDLSERKQKEVNKFQMNCNLTSNHFKEHTRKMYSTCMQETHRSN